MVSFKPLLSIIRYLVLEAFHELHRSTGSATIYAVLSALAHCHSQPFAQCQIPSSRLARDGISCTVYSVRRKLFILISLDLPLSGALLQFLSLLFIDDRRDLLQSMTHGVLARMTTRSPFLNGTLRTRMRTCESGTLFVSSMDDSSDQPRITPYGACSELLSSRPALIVTALMIAGWFETDGNRSITLLCLEAMVHVILAHRVRGTLRRSAAIFDVRKFQNQWPSHDLLDALHVGCGCCGDISLLRRFRSLVASRSLSDLNFVRLSTSFEIFDRLHQRRSAHLHGAFWSNETLSST